jgi:hypothetical protein
VQERRQRPEEADFVDCGARVRAAHEAVNQGSTWGSAGPKAGAGYGANALFTSITNNKWDNSNSAHTVFSHLTNNKWNFCYRTHTYFTNLTNNKRDF